MKQSTSLNGFWTLFRLALRRDRVKLPVWIVSLTLFSGWIVHVYSEFTAAEMGEVTIMASLSPGMRVLVAPVTEAGVGELGPFFILRMSLILCLFVSLMSVQLIMRHTRMNEETGCTELTGSMPVGRFASLGAAFLLGVAANAILGVSLSLAFLLQGLPAGGAWLAGGSFAGLGLVMIAVAAVAAQLSETARGASGYATMALALFAGVTSVSNVIGEVHEGGLGYTSHWLTWLSPVGWVQQVQPFEENRWFPLIVMLVFSLLLVSTAAKIADSRDIGAGVIPAKKGPAAASERLLSPLGLALRLQRKTWFAWLVPIAAFAVIFGASSGEYGEIAEGIAAFEAVIESEAYFLMSFIGIMTAIIAIYAMQTIMRMRAEEKNGMVEMVLSTAVARFTWVRSYLLLSIGGAALLILAFTTLLAFSAGADWAAFREYVTAGFAQGVALFTIAGAVTFLFGWLPRYAATLSWIVVFVSILAGPFFGAILELPTALQNLSPFSHVAIMPGDLESWALLGLAAAGISLLIAGLIGFRTRSLLLN